MSGHRKKFLLKIFAAGAPSFYNLNYPFTWTKNLHNVQIVSIIKYVCFYLSEWASKIFRAMACAMFSRPWIFLPRVEWAVKIFFVKGHWTPLHWSCTFLMIAWALELAHLSTILLATYRFCCISCFKEPGASARATLKPWQSCTITGRTCVWRFRHLADPCKKQADPEVNMLVKTRTPRTRTNHAPTRPQVYTQVPLR